MYESRGAMLGGGGVTDGFEGSKRSRMTDSNPYFAVSSGSSSDVYEAGSKRPQMASETISYFPMAVSTSSYQSFYNRSGYVGGMIAGVHPFPVVHLRGLPFSCEDLDILNFFFGLDIVECLLVNKNGRFNGEAYVVFSSPMQAELALQSDRQNIGCRYIEVFQCDKEDYYKAVAAEVRYGGSFFDGNYCQRTPPSWPKKTYEDKDQMEYTEVLKLRGLPYSVTRAEIVQFFGEEFGLKEENMHIACRLDGKATGEAFVEFASADMAKQAMSRDKMTIGTRYVELFPSTPDEMAGSRRFDH